MPLFDTVRDIDAQQHLLLSRAYGAIECAKGRFVRVQLKPWPKFGSIVESKWISPWKSRRRPADWCRLFYNQPLGHRNFLSLTFVESSWQTSLKTVFTALHVLDRIAYLKQSEAILAEVSNDRITDRALERWGWERYVEYRPQRHWIKRFYGQYPDRVTKSPAKLTVVSVHANGREN